MNESPAIWLASYPRSGNTFLRTILWHCFGLRSASVYPKDLGGNSALEEYVGHIEHGPDGRVRFPANTLRLVKTHELPRDEWPAIYVIRDGRAASVSLWKFYGKKIPLDEVIEGRHMFGTWANHVRSWNPWERRQTLLLHYESMRSDLPATLSSISEFLDSPILKETVPPRDTIAKVDGKWVKKKSDWREDLSGDLLKRFDEINHAVMVKAGYLS